MFTPECERQLPTYDHAEERAWRHLDSLQFLTYLHARPPRVSCPEHGVRQVRLPWAEPMSRFTNLFERMAVDVLKECDVLGASRLLRTSWDETWHLMERAVARGQAVKELAVPALVGVDENHLDDADNKIVFDRYHIMKYAVGAVDTVRKQENRSLVASGDRSLTGSKYLWLYSVENLPERHQSRFDELRSGDLKTSRAWAIKENLRYFWEYRRRGWAEKHWKSWYFWATHSRLNPIVQVARTLKRHLAGLLAFFDHRITSAGAEGLNSRIQAIRVSARGYRNRDNFKTAIYFHCGGLDLYPQTH